jgi:hypothetical protein
MIIEWIGGMEFNFLLGFLCFDGGFYVILEGDNFWGF